MGEPSLAGRRVLELGGYVAAPFAGHMLAHLGADVIKVESASGDPTRTLRRGRPAGTLIAYNTGKRSVCIDLGTSEGHAIFDRLLRTADVVVHNLAPSSARKLKVTYLECSRSNPDVIYCHITGYGAGPLENEVASNPIVEASTGVMFANRINGRPTRLGPSYHDMFAGANAVIGILAALASRKLTLTRGVGVGLYETGLYVAGKDIVAEQASPGMAQRDAQTGFSEFSRPGYGAYVTQDTRWIYLLILTDEHWRKFCRAFALPEEDEPSLATTSQRQDQSEKVEALVEMTIRLRSFDEAAANLRSIGLGYAEVKASAEVLSEPQARYPGKVTKVSYEGEDFTIPNFPIVSDSIITELESPPPRLGQHTLEILQSLEYSMEECNALLGRRVISAAE